MDKLKEAVEFIREKSKIVPEVGLILGSGLGEIAEGVEQAERIAFSRIPHFKKSTVKGHKGEMILGRLSEKNVAILSGRLHFYEGYTMEDVTFPVMVLARLGIKILLITNAAGAVNKEFSSGDLVLISDHINFMGMNPLRTADYAENRGLRRDNEEEFIDLCEAYSKRLQKIAKQAATELNVPLKQGIYCAVSGPSYETPAEINMLRIWGADLVGMSSVPAVIVARKLGLEVFGISCVTNMAAGVVKKRLSHAEVIEVTQQKGPLLAGLIKRIIKKI